MTNLEQLKTLSVREVSEVTGIPISAVHKLIKDGLLVSVMPYGNERGARVWVSELERFLRESATK